jgi:hypothetical protein
MTAAWRAGTISVRQATPNRTETTASTCLPVRRPPESRHASDATLTVPREHDRAEVHELAKMLDDPDVLRMGPVWATYGRTPERSSVVINVRRLEWKSANAPAAFRYLSKSGAFRRFVSAAAVHFSRAALKSVHIISLTVWSSAQF